MRCAGLWLVMRMVAASRIQGSQLTFPAQCAQTFPVYSAHVPKVGVAWPLFCSAGTGLRASAVQSCGAGARAASHASR